MTWTFKLGYMLGPNSLYATLPATRNSILNWLFDMPFDRTIMYHRWLGRWVVLLGTLHYIVPAVEWGGTFLHTTFKSQKYILGFVSWVGLVIVYLTSIGFLRRKHFNFFLASHFLFMIYFVFGTFHSEAFTPYAT